MSLHSQTQAVGPLVAAEKFLTLWASVQVMSLLRTQPCESCGMRLPQII